VPPLPQTRRRASVATLERGGNDLSGHNFLIRAPRARAGRADPIGLRLLVERGPKSWITNAIIWQKFLFVAADAPAHIPGGGNIASRPLPSVSLPVTRCLAPQSYINLARPAVCGVLTTA